MGEATVLEVIKNLRWIKQIQKLGHKQKSRDICRSLVVDITSKCTCYDGVNMSRGQEVHLRYYVQTIYVCSETKDGGPRYLSRYSDSLRAGRSGDRIPVEARYSAHVHTRPGATQPPV